MGNMRTKNPVHWSTVVSYLLLIVASVKTGRCSVIDLGATRCQNNSYIATSQVSQQSHGNRENYAYCAINYSSLENLCAITKARLAGCNSITQS